MRLLLSASFAGLLTCTCFCQESSNLIPGFKLSKPPVIDGTVDASEWAGVPMVSGGFDPNTKAVCPEPTQYFLAYDNKAIYLAVKFRDSQPGSISATEFRQNVDLSGNDSFSIAIDPFGQLTDFNTFTVSAAGGTQIAIAGGRAVKREWLGELQARTRITSDGWEGEVKIPWAIMRMPSPGKRNVRVNLARTIQRLQRTYSWQFVNNGLQQNNGIWTDIETPNVEERTLKLLPYVFGGYGRDNGIVGNAGLDVRAPITPTVDFVGSLYPDFRNVENAILGLNFSYFERLNAEARPFLLEGNRFFSTSFDAPIYTSQRIPRFDLGVKAVGKVDARNTIGILNTNSFTVENDLVAKYAYQFNPFRSLQVAVADRRRLGTRNTTDFVAYNHQIGALSFFGQHSRSNDSEVGTGHRTNVGVFGNRDSLSWGTEYLEISKDYLPRLGFSPQPNRRGMSGLVSYERQNPTGAILNYVTNFSAGSFQNFEGGGLQNKFYNVGGELTLRRNRLNLDGTYSYNKFRGNDDSFVTLEATLPEGDPYRSFVLGRVQGRQASEPFVLNSATFNYRPVDALQLTASFQDFKLGDDRETQVIGVFNYLLDEDRLINGRVVRTGNQINSYVGYRRIGRGAEYYLILGDPNSQTTRTVLVLKAVWPFELRF